MVKTRAQKIQAFTGFKPMTFAIPVQCYIWANKLVIMVIRNKLVKWYINYCEYIVVNWGLRDESDLRSNEHYLSSSENKAWKFQARTGFEPGMKFLNAKFEPKIFHLWNKIFKAQVSYLPEPAFASGHLEQM